MTDSPVKGGDISEGVDGKPGIVESLVSDPVDVEEPRPRSLGGCDASSSVGKVFWSSNGA